MKRLFSFILILLMIMTVGCSKDEHKLKVIAPSGAPAMSLVGILNKDIDKYDIELDKTADVLKSSFISLKADVIIAPINLGAMLYSEENDTYKLASVLTWGNLYFASQRKDFTIDDINNSTVILFGEGTINDVIVQYVLKEKGIILGAESTYLASTQNTVAQLISNKDAIVLVAEPALSTAKSKIDGINAISVQELYKEVTGNNSYPQAGCFIKSSTIKNHNKLVEEFLIDLENSCKECNNNTSEIGVAAVELGLGENSSVLESAIINSNIKYTKSIDAKSDIEAVVGLKPVLFGGASPSEEFYYN